MNNVEIEPIETETTGSVIDGGIQACVALSLLSQMLNVLNDKIKDS